MKRRVIFIFLVILLIIPIVYSESIDAPIKQLTYQAEQYETGNINYAQLLIYTSSIKKDIASSMGAISNEKDPLLSVEQLQTSLGKATDNTRWVWVQNYDKDGGYEKKLDNQVPIWRRIIFDGKNIQIWLNAWPEMKIQDDKEKMFYRLNMETRFKNPEDKIDIQSNINEIKSLGEKYSNDRSISSLEDLAKKSAIFEQAFQKYYSMQPDKCVDLMNSLFGSENKRKTQKILHEEIDFVSGDNFEIIFNIDMCDDCEWNWINLNANVQTRGKYNMMNNGEINREEMMNKYNSYASDDFKTKTKEILDEIKNNAINGKFDLLMKQSQELSIISEAWNQKANKIEQEMDQFKNDFMKMTQEERDECNKNFCWIKKEQQKKVKEKEIRNLNYQQMKQFYISLFNDAQKRESYYEEEQWEKRIFEKFKEDGEEICDNNFDDNKNNQIDCAEEQCNGKKCGYEIKTISYGNESNELKLELFCISGTCQQKENVSSNYSTNQTICQNHICEDNENLTCPMDCKTCPTYEAINCSGQAIFSGKDENGCMLVPICITEKETCESDIDCTDPLCGNSSCIEGKCQITQLSECKEAECREGEEKTVKCSSGEEIVISKCIDETLRTTGLLCKSPIIEKINETINEKEKITEDEKNNSEIKEEKEGNEFVGLECSVKEDCGNSNDVCSNGKCITLPETTESQEKIQEEIKAPEPVVENKEILSEGPLTQETNNEQGKVTGESILDIFKSIGNSILAITGYAIGDVPSEPTNDAPPYQEESNTNSGNDNSQTEKDNRQQQPNENIQTNQDNVPQNENNQNSDLNNNQDNNERQEQERIRQQEDQTRRQEEDKERRTNECSDNCIRQCNDNLIRPCTEDCIWKKCGNELKCDLDDTRNQCQTQCETQKDITSCEKDCNSKCLEGKDTKMEPDKKNQKQPESFVLSIIGTCRKAQGKEESMLWFNAWGDDMKDLHTYKMKYNKNNNNNEWCKQDLENLIKQRKELERSLNNEFAEWFYEKYVVNSDYDWEKHMSGINELYWMDIELSKQMADRMRCLGITNLPDFKLINFSYKTKYGSIEFWEEIKKAKMFEDSQESEIISPYMKTWLFPTKDFYKVQMKKSMENHMMIGSNDNSDESTNTLPTEVIEKLKQDRKFMNMVSDFNKKGHTNLAMQLKDFKTNEIFYNILIKINDKEIMYFEPMPVSELPSSYVTAELDVNKLLEMIEFEEKGRVELESPPWDSKPRQEFVKGTVDNVKMYFMFQGFINSLKVSESNVKGESKFFVENFFNIVMNGDKGGEGKKEKEENKDNSNSDKQKVDDKNKDNKK